MSDSSQSSGGTGREISDIPLNDWCTLCGGGYHPNLEIIIGDEPAERDGEKVYGWAHRQCKRDHDRAFLEAAQSGDLRPINARTEGSEDE